MTTNLRVGVLSFHNSKETRAILNAVDSLGHKPVWLRHGTLKLESDSVGVRIVPDVDVILNRLLLSTKSRPIELLGIADALQRAVPVLNPPASMITALNKISTATALGSENHTIPETLFSTDSQEVDEFINGRDEIVHKRAIGTHGSSTQLINNPESVITCLGDSYGLVQEKIPQDGDASDVRVYVVNGTIIASMERTAKDGDWRANIAQGGTGSHATLPPEIQETVLNAVEVIGLDFAGVDLMQHENGDWHILEVNPTAGFKGLFNSTGVNPAPYIAATGLQRIGTEPDEPEVESLATELDTSSPNIENTRTESSKPTIGLTATITIGGEGNTTSVQAKVDTGARRTSIDSQLASTIQAGPIVETATVHTASTTEPRVRPVTPVTIKLQGKEHTVHASIEDRSHMNQDVILGRDILHNYKIDLSLTSVE